ASVAEDIRVGLLEVGGREGSGALDRRVDPGEGVLADRRQLRLPACARGGEPGGRDLERVALAPARRLVLGLVGLRVALVVAVPAIGLGLDQEGPVAGAAALGRPLGESVDG